MSRHNIKIGGQNVSLLLSPGRNGISCDNNSTQKRAEYLAEVILQRLQDNPETSLCNPASQVSDKAVVIINNPLENSVPKIKQILGDMARQIPDEATLDDFIARQEKIASKSPKNQEDEILNDKVRSVAEAARSWYERHKEITLTSEEAANFLEYLKTKVADKIKGQAQ